ncbi:hypothetical protein FOA52_005871 [Chlamydomonas sp. UWO 241]|nr:hypothetical protein FOA52_005871 [Chlamydomonas sp. UWO 241]
MQPSRRVHACASEGRSDTGQGGGADNKSDNRPDRRASRAPGAVPPPKRAAAAERLTPKPLESLGPIGRPPTEQLAALGEAIDGMGEEEQDALAQRAEALEESLMRERMQGMGDDELRTYVDTVLDRYGSLEFVEATLLQPMMLDVVSEQLGQEDAALLAKLLVRDASTGDVGTGLNTHRPRQLRRQLAKLKRDERARLPGLLERLQHVQNEFHVKGTYKQYMDTKLSIRMARRARQKGLLPPDDAGGGGGAGAGSSGDGGSDDEAPAAVAGVDGGGGAEGVDGEDARRRGGGGASGSGRGQRVWGSSFTRARDKAARAAGPGAGAAAAAAAAADAGRAAAAERVASSVESMTRVAAAYGDDGSGWDDEALEGGPELLRLKRLAANLSVLSRLSVTDTGDTGLSARDYLVELRGARQELQLLMATGHRSNDEVVRETVDFVTTALAGVGEDGGAEVEIEPDTTALLCMFIRACEVWILYQSFYPALMESQAGSYTPELVDKHVVVLGQLTRDRWWLKSREDLGADESAELAGSGCDAVLHFERIEALAAVDPLQLRFLSELLSSGYSEDAILKWSLHPVIGPLLRSGDWLAARDGLPSIVQEAMDEAQGSGGEPLEGVDFMWQAQQEKQAEQQKSRAPRAPGTPPAAATLPPPSSGGRRRAAPPSGAQAGGGVGGLRQRAAARAAEAREQARRGQGTEGGSGAA